MSDNGGLRGWAGRDDDIDDCWTVGYSDALVDDEYDSDEIDLMVASELGETS